MRSAQADSAAFPGDEAWDQIDWPMIHRRMRGLQIRIAKATRDQDWRRVKALQRFLVNSFSAKALAVKRVTENDGKRTPGVDGEIWSSPGAKCQAIQRLGSRGLRPQPLRRVYIPKRGSDKMRPLGIPTMLIRAQQALHLLGLEPVAETRADPHSYGFRRSRGTQDAIGQVFHLLAQKGSAPWILEEDIKGCFDNFGHGWLESHVPMNKKVLRGWLKAGYVESGKLFPTEAGTPQGGIASPTIANIALDGLEEVLADRFGRTRLQIHRLRVRMVRYADDFIITGSSKELLEREVDHHIWQALWRWARRRHHKKSCRWIRQKYFRVQGHRHWMFATQTRGYDGNTSTLALFSASDTRIVRHVRVKSDANPFDPAWDSYFAQRQSTRMLERLQ
jgi:RNA-directed DNA polymerase